MLVLVMQELCQELWPVKLYPTTELYLSKFINFRHMLKNRPRIRFDGIYTCKFHYVRPGQSETSEYRPQHDVFTYKYIKFCENGKAITIYTVLEPQKFLHKLKSRV